MITALPFNPDGYMTRGMRWVKRNGQLIGTIQLTSRGLWEWYGPGEDGTYQGYCMDATPLTDSDLTEIGKIISRLNCSLAPSPC